MNWFGNFSDGTTDINIFFVHWCTPGSEILSKEVFLYSIKFSCFFSLVRIRSFLMDFEHFLCIKFQSSRNINLVVMISYSFLKVHSCWTVDVRLMSLAIQHGNLKLKSGWNISSTHPGDWICNDWNPNESNRVRRYFPREPGISR